MKTLIVILNFILLNQVLYSQDYSFEEKQGTVTYISSQNVYVKFDNTSGITTGDSLYEKQNGRKTTVAVVKFISSTSCAGEFTNGKKIKVGDHLYVQAKLEIEQTVVMDDSQKIKVSNLDTNYVYPVKTLTRSIKTKPAFSGRISAQSYTNLSNFDKRGDYQRWRYTVSFNANEIDGSKLSLSTYTSFAYRADQWNSVTSNLGRSLRVYDFSLNYKFDETMNLWAGRHINRKITNVSSIDGLQFEKYFSENYVGVIAGSRPNFSDMGWNSKLFQFGAYYGRTDTIGGKMMENTFGIIQQTNDFKIDRRFVYYQHNNSVVTNVNIFLSSEIDLYKKIAGNETNELSLTSLYGMIRYSPARIFSVSGSYDARKNVIYYETFRNFIDSVFENETRQGAALRMNLNPVEYLYLGVSGGYRDSKRDLRPSKNYNGFITYSRIPFVDISSTVSYNNISSSYVDGSIYGIRLTRNITGIDADISVGYRRTQYTYITNSFKTDQNNLSIDFSLLLFGKTFLNFGYEGTFEKTHSLSQMLLDLTTRF